MSENCNHNCSSCDKNCADRTDFRVKQNELSNIKKVIGVVSGKGGVGNVSVYLDGDLLGGQWMSEEVKEYSFGNPEQYHGNLEIKFANLTKALFIKKIFIHFVEETENPNDFVMTKASRPTGPITGIYSVTGQFMGNNVEVLPQGLFFVKHTDGTEKVLVP